ncbi:hypothetical protein PENTCL1PPCAC_13728, partial [Pristionchus entomophagus]
NEEKMKKKDEKIIEDLRKQVDKACNGSNYKKASDLALELAQTLRNHGERERAIDAFKKVITISEIAQVMTDTILGHRGVAELLSELGDEECHAELRRFEKLVEKDPTEHQLMLTVGAYCMLKLYSFDDSNDQLLPRARKYLEKSLSLLNTANIDTSKFLDGDSLTIRKINCHRMLSETACYQGEKEEAEKHSKEAYEHAAGRTKVRFELLRARIDFAWRDKVKAAKDLCALSESMTKEKKIEAHVFLAQAYFEHEKLEEGIETLFNISEALSTKGSAVDQDEREKYSGLLIFGYKARERLKQLQKCSAENDEEGQYCQMDALGDLYSNAGYKNVALKYYGQSLRHASGKLRRDALISCAETAVDLKLFEKAAEHFDQLRLEEITAKMDTSETVASLFEVRLRGNFFKSDSDVIMEIFRLERNGNKFMNSVYNTAAVYFSKKGNKEEAARFRKLEKGFLNAKKGDEKSKDNEEEEDDQKIPDDIDELDDNFILNLMTEQAKQFGKKKLLAKQARKSNQYGESKLIERSREGTLDEVKHLVEKLGANINEADPVGWTPLSEAVAANNFTIVKYLLSKGAMPNSQSKEGWMETDFRGKITPLHEACTNGFHEIARWLLSHKMADILVVTTNEDGWSAADFLADYIKRTKRGDDESEAEYRDKLNNCKDVLEQIKRRQRTQGFPVRTGDPPPPRPKSDDTPRFAKEKEATRRAERSQRTKGAVGEYEEVMTSVGSRSKKTEEESRKKLKEKEEEDLFNASDDEPLIRPSSANNKKRAIVLSDSEEEPEERRESTKENRQRKSLDFDDPNFGLEEDGDERPSSSMKASNGGGSQFKKLSGIEMLMQKKKGKKRSTERGDENGISIVSDDIVEIKQRTEHKRRRQDSESSQSEAGSAVHADRRHSIGSLREQSKDIETASPVGIYRTESRSSLSSFSSASALAFTGVQIVVVRAGRQPEPPFISKAPSDAEIADLPKHIERLRSTIDGETCEWRFQGMAVGTEEKMTLGDLAAMYNQPRLEIECRVKKTLKGDFQSRCDVADRSSPLSTALGNFEKSRTPSLILADGSKYSEKSLEALWQVVEEYAAEKRKENGQWRVESVQIEHFNVPPSALRTLLKLRPRETLSLRFCGLDDRKLEEMAEELAATDLSRLLTLDCSFNPEISSSEVLAKFINGLRGLHTIVLQGLSGIEDGLELMTTLRDLPKLTTLILDENPWLDDHCMAELIRGDNKMGRLNQLKISKVAIRLMLWMTSPEAFKSLRSLNLSENNGISASGWERLGSFIRSNVSLKSLDVRGTTVRPVILEALADRSSDSSNLIFTVSRCSGITASEICRIFGPLMHDDKRIPNLKVVIESEKMDEVRASAPDVVAKLLKAAPPV